LFSNVIEDEAASFTGQSRSALRGNHDYDSEIETMLLVYEVVEANGIIVTHEISSSLMDMLSQFSAMIARMR